MKFSQFFIDRPIFAAVLSLLIVVGGALRAPAAARSASIPSVVPPTVVVRGVYPGANPKVIAETVASPLEQQLNGVEGLLYMFSQATADGRLTLTVTFALGTDLDIAQVQVQNRVSQALPRLPQDVQRIGVTTEKASPDFLLVAHLVSPDDRYDMLYLSNFAHLQVKDELARIPGVGSVQIFGAGEYSMRVWLDPDKLAARQLTATDVVRAIREQNVQVAAGTLGAPPAPSDTTFQLSVNAQGRLASEEEFTDVVVRATPEGQITRLGDVGTRRARVEHVCAAQPARQSAGGRDRHRAAPGVERARSGGAGARGDGAPQADVPRRRRIPHRLRPDDLRSRVDPLGRRRRSSKPSCWSSSW